MYSTFAPQLCRTAVMKRTVLKISQGQVGNVAVGNRAVFLCKGRAKQEKLQQKQQNHSSALKPESVESSLENNLSL